MRATEKPAGAAGCSRDACGIRKTDEELAGLRYRDLPWKSKRLAEGHVARASPATARAARCAMVVAVAQAEAVTFPTDDSSASVPTITDCAVRLTDILHDRTQSADTVSLQPGTSLGNPFTQWCPKHGGSPMSLCANSVTKQRRRRRQPSTPSWSTATVLTYTRPRPSWAWRSSRGSWEDCAI